MRIASATSAAVIASLLVIMPATAFADHTVVVVAQAKGELLDRVRNAAESAGRYHQWTIVDAVEKVHAAKLVKCVERTNGKCVSRKLARTKADSVLMITAKRSIDDDGQARIVVSGQLFERKTGRFVNSDQRYCVRCYDLARLDAMTTRIVARLLRNRAVELAPNTWLVVRTIPENAIVVIDSSRRGPSGQTLRVGAGPHEVRVERAGYRTFTQTAVVKPNETKVLAVQLVRLDKPKKHQKKRRHHRTSNSWKWTGGTGAALFLGGLTLMIAHQPKIDSANEQPTVFESRKYGIGATIAGAALLVTSAVLFYRARKEKRATTQVSVGVFNDAVTVVVGSRF